MAAGVTDEVASVLTEAVASSLLAPILTNRSSHLEILGVSSGLVWLSLDGEALTIQSVSPDSPLALPTSIFLPSGTPSAKELCLREGRLMLGEAALQITRWWHPPRAQVVTWAGTFGAAPEIDVLLGRGSGLTPEGDDLVAGWLILARSIGHPRFESIHQRVLNMSAARTTSFSCALLQCAAQGYGVAPLIDYVTSLLENRKDISAVRGRLAQVGHTSGEALAIGVEMALDRVGKHIEFPRINSQERAIA